MPAKRKASQASNADSAIGDSPRAKKNKSSSDNQSTVEWKFLTHGRPDWDWDRQYDEREDIPTDEYRAQNQYQLKSPDEHPGWPWIVSQKAWDIYCRYMVELQKRDQDKWQMHIYTDFTGYGVIELLHNLVCYILCEFRKRDGDPSAVFFELEGLVLFMTMEEQLVSYYLGVDDGDQVCESNTVIVKAFLATLHLLHQHDLLKPDGPIKSLRTCITSFLHWLQETPTNTYFKDEAQACQTPAVIAAYCNANKLDYRLAYDIESFVADVKVSPMFSLNRPGDDPYKFRNGFRHVRKEPAGGAQRGHLGYKFYDLTKWPKKRRLEYTYGEDGVDPMDMLGPEFKELDKTLKEPYP